MTSRSEIENALDFARFQFIATSLFPRSIMLFSPAFYGPRGLSLYIVASTLLFFSVRYWLGPRWIDWGKRYGAEVEALRERLGRQPTNDEIMANWRAVKAAGR